MRKSAKGAIAMVLVGAVTFSVTNVLFSGHTLKQSAQAIASTISKTQTKTDKSGHSLKLPVQMNALTNISSQNSGKEDTAENKETTQTLSTDGKNVQPSAQKVDAVQADLHNANTGTETAAIQTVTVPVAAPIAVQPVHTATAPTTAISATPVQVYAPNTGTSATPVQVYAPNTGTSGTASTAAPVPKSSPTLSPSTSSTASSSSTSTTPTTNHGQQVSQLAKEKAATHKK